MFWDILVSLCVEHNITPSALTKELSIAKGVVTKWKNGSVPHHTTLLKIANHFNVSVEYLIGEKNEKALVFGESFTASEKELVVAYRKHPEMHDAVHKILGIEKEKSVSYINPQETPAVRVAANSGKNYSSGDEEETEPIGI